MSADYGRHLVSQPYNEAVYIMNHQKLQTTAIWKASTYSCLKHRHKKIIHLRPARCRNIDSKPLQDNIIDYIAVEFQMNRTIL